MIIDKKIKVKITRKNLPHYIKFFQDLNLKDIIEVDIETELTKGSNIKINAKCDICGIERTLSFQMYNRNLNSCPEYKIYTCDKCSHLKLKETNKKVYGVEYYSQTSEYSEKFKKTMRDKYGVDHALQNKDIIENQKNNNLKKYGVKNVFQSEEIKSKIKETNLKKYGYEHIQSVPEIRNRFKETMISKYGADNSFVVESLRQKSKKTNLEKYGVDNYSKSANFIEKVKTTNIQKYGVDWVTKLDSVKKKSKETFSNKYGVDNIAKLEHHRKDFKISNDSQYINYINNSVSLFSCEKGHNFEIHFSIYNNRKKYGIPLCTVCNPVGENSSIKQDEIYKFICGNYSGRVIKSYRDGLEIDIYLPDINLGFEFNGLYWHSEIYKERGYHINKTTYFKKLGIDIFHIWEDDWIYKNEIVKSMILNKLGKSKKIGARECYIREINNKDCKKFLNDNHIQGWCISKYRYGLFYKEELLSVMTFGNLRINLGQKNKTGQYELLRFCNKKYTSVIGGASKILKYFKDLINPIRIVSYSKNDYSNGNLYKTIGFKFEKLTSPNYYWVVNSRRENRYKWRKDVLVKMGGDIKMSESSIMISNGYYRIFDSGNTRWIL